jgi:RNA polymerase sigma factor (sigma-70 family)
MPNRLRPPLDDRQRSLATRYLPLARSMARRMAAFHPQWKQEFQSAAFLALVEAALAFDPARNVDFSTYARHGIWGALLDTRRELQQRPGPGRRSMSRTVIRLSAAAEQHGRVLNTEPDEPVGTELEREEMVEAWISRMPRAQSRAFRLIYQDGRTQEEAADVVGCSSASMSRLHEQGLDWLRHGHGHGPRRNWSQEPESAREACA